MPTFFGRRYMRKELKRPTEVYLGIFILLLSASICMALVLHSRSPGEPLFEVSAEYLQRQEETEAAAVDLPRIEAANWSEARRVRTFSPDNLYEKINGRADLFLQYRFRQLTFARYVNEDNPDIDIQIYMYDMSAPENAQGIYRAELSGHPDEVTIGQAGYRSGPSIFFWKGPMYVSVMAFEESLFETCLSLAEALAADIEEEKAGLWAEVLFPQENRVDGVLDYLATDAFGLDFLDEVYTAHYPVGTGRIVLFAHQAADPADAQKLLNEYIRFFEENGTILSKSDGITVGESGGVIDAVLCQGRYLIGASEAADADVALSQAKSLRGQVAGVMDKLP